MHTVWRYIIALNEATVQKGYKMKQTKAGTKAITD